MEHGDPFKRRVQRDVRYADLARKRHEHTAVMFAFGEK